MGVYSGPEIINDGLVLSLDAANSKGFDDDENLLTYSEQFDDASWAKIATSVSANTTIAPDGTLTADTVTISAGGHVLRKEISVTQNTQYTFSFYVKRGTASNLAYSVYNITASAEFITATSYYSQTSATDWVRISVTFTTPSGCTSIGVYPFRDGGTTGTAFVWGAQLEIGSTANSYYATTSTAKNRGTIWSDLSGNGNTGTLTNGVGYNNSNIGSFVFDGVNDFVLLSSNTTFGNNTTWEAWIYATANVSTYNMFMGRFLPYFGFYTGNRFIFSNLVGGTQRTIQTATTNLSLNTWYHATFTTSYDGANTTMKIYTNGVETTTGTFVGTQGNYSNPFMIGDGNNGNTTWYPFAGRVSNVKIYNKTLSTTEIQQNYNATKSRYGL